MPQEKHKNNTSKAIHEINNLLTNISLSAELLNRELYGKLNLHQKKYVKIILSENKKISEALKVIKN